MTTTTLPAILPTTTLPALSSPAALAAVLEAVLPIIDTVPGIPRDRAYRPMPASSSQAGLASFTASAR